MARPHAPGDRLKMEQALGPAHVRTLAEQCQAIGVPVARWHLVPAFARPWEMVAVVRLAEEIRKADGTKGKAAVEEAAVMLGLEPDTALSRLNRWRTDAYKRAA